MVSTSFGIDREVLTCCRPLLPQTGARIGVTCLVHQIQAGSVATPCCEHAASPFCTPSTAAMVLEVIPDEATQIGDHYVLCCPWYVLSGGPEEGCRYPVIVDRASRTFSGRLLLSSKRAR